MIRIDEGRDVTREKTVVARPPRDFEDHLETRKPPKSHSKHRFAVAALTAASFLTPGVSEAGVPPAPSPALTFEIDTAPVRQMLQLMSVDRKSQCPMVAEFEGLLADRLSPNLVPFGFLHQCRQLVIDIKTGNIPEASKPALAALTSLEAEGLTKFLAGFIAEVCPKVCPRIYTEALNDLVRAV